MQKAKLDPKVKKSLIRNYEIKAKPSRKQVVHDVACSSKSSKTSQKENELSQPTLCSSEVLANYLSDAKKSVPPPLSEEDLNVDKGLLSSKMTKKLNFHYNDRMFKNLVELNTSIEDCKRKKDRRPSTTSSIKKDLEPNIEDFCVDEEEIDSPPHIPVLKPKMRPIKKVEDGILHKIVAAFEDL